MNNSKFNEEEANKRFDEKYGNRVNPDRNPLFDPDGNDFTDAFFQNQKSVNALPDTTPEENIQDVSFQKGQNDTIMIPTEIKFQDGTSVLLTKQQGVDITNGKGVQINVNGVQVSVSYNQDSDKGVTVKVSEPKNKEDNVIKINKPKLRL